MSAALETRAEILKLARLLEVDPEQLEFLRAADASDLVALREQVTDSLYSQVGGPLQRLASAAKLVPGGLAAAVAQRAMGPVLCARLAGVVDPSKAIEVARHLPAPFLSDVAIHVDPRRAKTVIAKVPPAIVAQVGAELDQRDEFVTMGRFVGFVGDDAIRAALPEISDSGLLQIGFVMEGKERLDYMIGLIPPERLPLILHAAADLSLWPELLDLFTHVGPELKGTIGDLAACDEELLDSLARAAGEEDLWDGVLPLVPVLSDLGRRRIATMAARLDEPILLQVIGAVEANDMWSIFIPLAADYMDDDGRARIAALVATVDQQLILTLAEAVERDRLWAQLLQIAEQMRPDQLEPVADRLLSAGLEDRLPSLLAAVEETGLWETGLQMLASLPEGLKARLAPAAATLSEAERRVVLEHARELGLTDQLSAVLS